MAVAFRAGTSATAVYASENTKTLTVTPPSSGDYIVAVYGFNSAYYPMSTVPSGFVSVVPSTTAQLSGIQIWLKKATASETGSYTFVTTNNTYGGIAIAAYSGCNAESPLDALSSVQSNASSTTISWPSITVPSSSGFLALAAGIWGGAAITADPATFTVRANSRCALYDKSISSGATGTFSGTLNTAADTLAVSMHLNSVARVPSNYSAPVVTGNNWNGQTLTCNPGSWLGVFGLASPYAYQWKRDGTNIASATASTYNLTSSDVGHTVTCTVTPTNATGAGTAATSNGILVQFHNSVAPTFTGTAAAGNTYTAVAGTWDETISTRTYHWLADGVDIHTGSTFTPAESEGSRRITVREDVTGPLGSGSATSTSSKIFYALTVPWGTTGSPYRQALPVGVAVDAAMTSTLQGYLTSMYGAGYFWFGEGGPYGHSYSEYLNVVDSSMARTSFDMAPLSGFAGTPETNTKNGASRNHLAWIFGTKDGGIPTPPGGFKVVGGSDAHMAVYCTDTKEFWATWNTDLTGYAKPRFWAGCYIPDVSQFVGYFQDLTTSPGSEADPLKEYANWGEQAVNAPMWEGILTQRELAAGTPINHMVGVLLPQSNGVARWPDGRAEAGSSSMPLGGIWQLDPALDPASLATTGNAGLNALRTNLIYAFQTYGVTVVDTTAANFGIRFESVTNAADSFNWGTLFTPSLHNMMRTIPTTSWRVISSSYRPTGGPQLPVPTDISLRHFLPSSAWSVYGGEIDGTGRLTMGAYGGDGGQAYTDIADPLTIDGSSIYMQLVQPAGAVTFRLSSIDAPTTNYLEFEKSGANLNARAVYSGSTSGTTTSATYSGTNHKWLRMRVDTGTITWEVSADSSGVPASWTSFKTMAVPGTFFDLTRLRVYIRALGNTIGVSDGTAIFRNLSQVPAPVATSPGWVVGVS